LHLDLAVHVLVERGIAEVAPFDAHDDALSRIGLEPQPPAVRRGLPHERAAPRLVPPRAFGLIVDSGPELPVIPELAPGVPLAAHPLLVAAAVGPDFLAGVDVVSLARPVEEVLPEVEVHVPVVPGLALPFRVVDVRDEGAHSYLVRGLEESQAVDVELGRFPAAVHARAPSASHLADVERAAAAVTL